jgi:hypothetical protein
MGAKPQAPSRPGSAACPRTPRTTRARSTRPCGQTLAVPENPGQPKNARPRRCLPKPPDPQGGPIPLANPAPTLTARPPARNHRLQPPLNRARSGPMPLAKRRSYATGGRHAQQWESPTVVAGVDGELCTGLGAITSVADKADSAFRAGATAPEAVPACASYLLEHSLAMLGGGRIGGGACSDDPFDAN